MSPSRMQPTALSIGFLPLTDCAVLVAAHEQGFAAAEGLSLTLVRDTSWATARDRLVFRQVQAAHMLAPLAVGVSLGIGGHRTRLAAPFGLNLNGNQIVVSGALALAMRMAPDERAVDPAGAARALAVALAGRRGQGHESLPVFGIVHRLSSHALLLRYWLASAGILPDRDVNLRVVPPSLMVEALVAGEIDGFCAGEPWGSLAVNSGHAQTAAIGARLWRHGVEKVLAFRQDWMELHPEPVDRLLRALHRAAAWCEDPANHPHLAELLARPHYLDQPQAGILPALQGRVSLASGLPPRDEPDLLVFHRGNAGLPRRSQALWIYAQFVRWGLLPAAGAAQQQAADVFRPDIHRRALGRASPGAGQDGPDPQEAPLFDGRLFDAEQIERYLASFPPSPV